MKPWKERYVSQIKRRDKGQKLNFIHIPKCGGSYVREVLKEFGIQTKGHLIAKQSDGITFAVIREPGERFESLLNYRLGFPEARKDWPDKLKYVFADKSVTLDEIVNQMTDSDIIGFYPYRTLEYWSQNVKVLMTMNELPHFLQCFGYPRKGHDFPIIPNVNVSVKERGKLSNDNLARVRRLYQRDVIIYERWT